MTGFEGLAHRHFNGDLQQARQYVADLGAAHYFSQSKAMFSAQRLLPYRDKFPVAEYLARWSPFQVDWNEVMDVMESAP